VRERWKEGWDTQWNRNWNCLRTNRQSCA